MAGLDWNALETAALRRDPFDHLHVPQALTPRAAAAIPAEFPQISGDGSYSLADAPPGPALQAVIDDLNSERFRRLMEDLFGLDLSGRATTVTLRGQCGLRDGYIHTDSRSKVLSLLIYLNEGWTSSEGRLRLLRSDANLEDVGAEIPPTLGSLVVFRRSERSWHGHTRFVGQRRSLQFNYVRSDVTTLVSAMRHRLSALVKSHQAA